MRKILTVTAWLVNFGTAFFVNSWGQSSCEPLLQRSDLLYLGAVRVPDGEIGNSRFAFGGTALAFNPQRNSLFIVGHPYQQQIAEISIPYPVNTQNLRELLIGSVIQPFAELLGRLPNYGREGTVEIGGLIVVGNKLYGTLYEFYDGEGDAPHPHVRFSSLDLSNLAVASLFQVGATITPGFVAGYTAEIPPEWQDDFGVPYLTGQAALPIISRTSAGPAAFGFDIDDLRATPAPVIPVVYCPISHALAPEDTQDPFFNLATSIDGVLFVRGYRSIVFFGSHGIGPYCYGTGQECNDAVRESKETHAYPYVYQAWVYDVEDPLLVKNGIQQPWTVQPYAIWTMELPFANADKAIGGVTHDPQTGRVFISQMNIDLEGEPRPIIHVFRISELQEERHPPSKFNLLLPEDGVRLKQSDSIQLIWNSATDQDGDALIYSLNIIGAGLDTTISGTDDTSFIFQSTKVWKEGKNYNWSVNASDGSCTTPSADTFSFRFSSTAGRKIVVNASDSARLPEVVSMATENDTILLEPGTYSVSATLHFFTDNVTLRSSSANRNDVILDGGYTTQGGTGLGEVIYIGASGITIRDVSISHAKWHAIHLVGNGKTIENILLDNLHVYDCGQQLIKANPSGSPPDVYYVDKVTLQNSLVEFIDNSLMEPSGEGFYTGGLDAHAAKDWVVRDNVFRGISNNAKHMEHAIHFWRKGRNVTVERNLIVNCYRDIGFGLLTSPDPDRERHYDDQSGDAPYRDQIDGIIRNNVIINDPGIFMDSGVSLANALGAKVYHNTVVSGNDPRPFNCIEYRWSQSTQIINNLTSHLILEREGNFDTTINHNLTNIFPTMEDIFLNVSEYNLRLRGTATEAVNNGIVLSEVIDDFDKQERDANPDIGAFEHKGITTGIEDSGNIKPMKSVLLKQNYPNPFNLETTITYRLFKSGMVRITVHDINGRYIKTLINERKNVGVHKVRWNPHNLSSGVYYFQIQAYGVVDVKQAVLLK